MAERPNATVCKTVKPPVRIRPAPPMIIGIDYGLSKIGVAITEGEIPSPLITYPNNKFFVQNLKQKISEKPEKIVIGTTTNQPYREKFERFVNNLQLEFQCDIIYFEEDFSTKEAKKRLGQSQMSKRRRKKDDAMAACIILERYLEENSSD